MNEQITISIGMLNAIIKSAKDDAIKEVLNADMVEETYLCRIDLIEDELAELDEIISADVNWLNGVKEGLTIALVIMRGNK